MRTTRSPAFLLLLWSVFVFNVWVGSARAEVVQPKAVESGQVIVISETAEIREGPSPNAEVIAVVDKGEIFEKLGRTMRWYLVKVDDEITGWISGRYIRRYQEGGAQYGYPSGVPYDGRNYPSYYPGDYYSNPYYNPYFYGWPFFSGDWYFYGGGPYRGYDRYPSGGWHGPTGPPGGGGPGGYPGGGGGPHVSPMPMPHPGGGGGGPHFPHR